MGASHETGGKEPGFSLVEVVLAVGIISFAILALLGLLTSGQRASRENQDRTDDSLIARVVESQLRAKPFGAAQSGRLNPAQLPLPSLTTPGVAEEFFVDGSGAYLGGASETPPAEAVARVEIAVLTPGVSGVTGEAFGVADGLARVQVRVVRPAALGVGESGGMTSTFLTEIADRGTP